MMTKMVSISSNNASRHIRKEFSMQENRPSPRTIYTNIHLSRCRNKRWGPELATSANNSIISQINIRPAGQFSSIFIDTYTKLGVRKNFGGDSWRVEIFGSAEVAPTVFDLQNGTYEALFLLIEPGKYTARITLDYSLCRGLIDMQDNWYILGKQCL